MSGPAGGRGRSREVGNWLAATILVPLLLFVAAAWYDRSVIISNAQDRMVALVGAMAANADAVSRIASLALSLQLDAIDDMDWSTVSTSSEVHRLLVDLHDRLPQIDSAFFVDATGHNSASSREFPMPAWDVHERDYFVDAQQHPDQTIVSAPFRGLTDGTTAFVISRARVTGGKFDGIAAVTLSPEYFHAFYRELLTWPVGPTATLLRGDGRVLIRYPPSPAVESNVPATSPAGEALALGRPSGSFQGVSSVDGRTKLGAYRRLPNENLVVSYTIDLQRCLAEWYLHLAIFAGFALTAALALSLTAVTTIRRAAREQANLHALVTESERRQQAETAMQHMQKMEALGRLTGGVAHDFNNLLAAILGSLELALRRITDERAVRLLRSATQAAERGAKLTAQMLAFARKQPVEPKMIACNDVIRGMDELLHRSTSVSTRFVYDLPEGLWPVLADPMQLELALLNLVVNAHDAMPSGGEVAVRTRNVPANAAVALGLPAADHVCLSVSDTGGGMPPEVQAQAFEPFFTTKGPGKGTGLGLSMVYGFTRQAGGAVRIDSTVGKGTTVSLLLPRYLPTEAVEDPRPDGKTDKVPPLSVLLVDDDDAVRSLTREMLRDLGHAVIDADSGAAALAVLARGDRVDVMAADFAMPGMNGGELAERARALRPALPILFVTGYAEEAVLRRWEAKGARTVAKPFRQEALEAALRQLLLSPSPAG